MNTEELITLFLENKGTLITEALLSLGFVSSKGEAKKMIEQNAIKLGSKKLTNVNARIFNIDNKLVMVEKNSNGIIDITTKF